MHNPRLTGFRAIVTGASGGIGLAIAHAFARQGAATWLVARDPTRLAAAAEQLRPHGHDVMATVMDLTEVAAISRLAAQVRDQWGKLDVLVNNAGIARFTPFDHAPPAEIDAQVKLNLLAPYLLTQQLLPLLQTAAGNVINISSTSARRLIPGRPASAYAMTKGGLESLTKALALELGPRRIRVNAIAPGTIDTPLTQKMIAAMSPQRKADYDKFVADCFALGALGTVEDVAAAAVYLASPDAKWVTGATLTVDGGLTTN